MPRLAALLLAGVVAGSAVPALPAAGGDVRAGVGPGAPPGRGAPAAFLATRHPDTADTGGPYHLIFRQIAGPAVSGGRVEFAVTRPDGSPVTTGQVAVHPERADRSWGADLPGQAVGSTIAYHAVFAGGDGVEVRHPARAPAAYRFRIVTLHQVSLSLPEARDLERGRAPLWLLVEASAPPTGNAVVRVLRPGDPNRPGAAAAETAAEEQRIPLKVRRRGGVDSAASLYEMKGDLPPPAPGGIIDFYVEARLPAGEEVRMPLDAPGRVYTIKRSIVPVRRVAPGRDFVLDVASVGRQHWIGLQGGGLQVIGPGRRSSLPGPGSGLVSSVARFVLPDPATGQVYVGTDSGVVGIGAAGESWVAIGPPRPSAWAAASSVSGREGWRQRAGPGALSTLDGTLLFQIQGDAADDSPGPANLVRLRDGRLTVTALPAPEMPLVGLSFAGFDASDGCLLIAGYMRQGRQGLKPAAMESCDGTARPIALIGPDLPEGSWTIERVVALARDPSMGGLVAAVELLGGGAPERRPAYGVFRVDSGSGRLSSLDAAVDLLDIEITSLLPDRARGRLLIGTVGRGVLALRPGEAGARADTINGLAAGVTALRLDDATGAILVGTVRGAFELPDDGGPARPIGPGGDGPGLMDALPMDVDPATGHVLLSSHVEGLIQLAPAAGGRWEIAAHLKPGRDLPEGFYGDAAYGPAGRLVAILRTRGLLVREGGASRVLTPADGLTGSLLLRVMARRNGDIWVAHSPLPFGTEGGATLQVIRDGHVELTVPMAGRDLATIARWVEEPEGDALLAATRAGLVAIRPDGTFEPLSSHAVSSVAVDTRTGSIGVAGSQVERRGDDGRFLPVLFAVRHPRWATGIAPEGGPIDLAIDSSGTWFLLYPGGLVVLLRPESGFLGLLDPEDGIPPTAHQLLGHPETGAIFVGSAGEGLVVLGPSAVRWPGGSP